MFSLQHFASGWRRIVRTALSKRQCKFFSGNRISTPTNNVCPISTSALQKRVHDVFSEVGSDRRFTPTRRIHDLCLADYIPFGMSRQKRKEFLLLRTQPCHDLPMTPFISRADSPSSRRDTTDCTTLDRILPPGFTRPCREPGPTPAGIASNSSRAWPRPPHGRPPDHAPGSKTLARKAATRWAVGEFRPAAGRCTRYPRYHPGTTGTTRTTPRNGGRGTIPSH